MSLAEPAPAPAAIPPASVFAALGDATRLELVRRLAGGQSRSIAQLADGFGLTRQGVTKHLHVLERAGIVARQRVGRESRFSYLPVPIQTARSYLTSVNAQWDAALARLKRYVEP